MKIMNEKITSEKFWEFFGNNSLREQLEYVFSSVFDNKNIEVLWYFHMYEPINNKSKKEILIEVPSSFDFGFNVEFDTSAVNFDQIKKDLELYVETADCVKVYLTNSSIKLNSELGVPELNFNDYITRIQFAIIVENYE